ncbi:transcriptional regulator [Variovorax sp. tm]
MSKPRQPSPEDEASRERTREVLLRIAAVMGSQAAAGAACGKTQGHFSHWLKVGLVPAEHCPALEGATRAKGSVVHCEAIRPDVPWRHVRGWPPVGDAQEEGAARA